MAATCTAPNLSDESQCQEEASSPDGLFCRFHTKQCYGLYRGYKIRNARLDALNASPPPYLADSKTPLRNEDFAEVTDEATLNELHNHLFKKHGLLDRVIRARKLHHSRFYALNLDYGHKAYLDKLTNDKFVVVCALERLERRTAEVLYAQQKWFKWVRESQDEEEAGRLKESEMIKKEAGLFRRHWKAVETRLREKKKSEDAKRQDTFLEEAYRERQAQRSSEEEEEDEEAWDPIEDATEEDKGHLARKWQQEGRPSARFALIHIWTHSRFYPLMLGYDNRSSTSFYDALLRSWEWKFIPKDMPGSEWSMQKSVEIRTEPFKQQFKQQVVVKRDTLLVLGTDEEDLRRIVLGAVFAVQTKPWRMDVDFWKTFVNVDLDFLEGLDGMWLE